MKFKNLFCVSGALIKEILRMHWYIPIFTFLLYFFVGIMPLISNFSDIELMDYYIYGCLKNMNIAYAFIMGLVPVVTGVLIMGFVHKESKALMIHAQPLSKNRIFNSYYLAGWLMCCVLPLILMIISYMGLSLKIDYLGYKDIIFWIFSSVATMTLFYATTVFAGSLTGTTVMNLLASGVLMVIFPVAVAISDAYCKAFINGYYTMPEIVTSLANKYNPILHLVFQSGNNTWRTYLIYFIIGIVLSLLAKYIYKTRKLELIGSSTLSKAFEEVMVYMVVFVGMSLFGLLIWNYSDSKALIIAGMLIGTVITFVIVKIIVKKSTRIFDKDTLKSIVIYFAIATVFVGLTVFDITGFSKKVPELEDVKSVDMTDLVSGFENYSGIEGTSSKNVKYDGKLDSPESLEKIIELHQYIIDNNLIYASEDSYGVEVYDMEGMPCDIANEIIHIKYELNNGKVMERVYDVEMDENVAKLLDEILTGEEYKEKNKITSYVNMDNISYIQITGLEEEYYYYDYDSAAYDEYEEQVKNSGGMAVIKNPKVIKELLNKLDEDTSGYGYIHNNSSITYMEGIANIEIFFEKSKKKKNQDIIGITLYKYNNNALAYLSEMGYGFIVGENEG